MPSKSESSEQLVRELEHQVPEVALLVQRVRSENPGRDVFWALMGPLRHLVLDAYERDDRDLALRVVRVLNGALAPGQTGVYNAVAVVFLEDVAWHEDALAGPVLSWPEPIRSEVTRQREYVAETRARHLTPEETRRRAADIFDEVRALNLGPDRIAVVTELSKRLDEEDLLVDRAWVEDEVGKRTQRWWTLRHPIRHLNRHKRRGFIRAAVDGS